MFPLIAIVCSVLGIGMIVLGIVIRKMAGEAKDPASFLTKEAKKQ